MDRPAELDWAALPGPLRYGLLLGSSGRPHLAGLARLALATPATQDLGLSLLHAAWRAAPLDASLAGALDALNRGRAFLSPETAACVRAVAAQARPPADTGPLAELAARRDHAGLARFLDQRLAAGDHELFWRAHRLDLAFLLADWDRARELAHRPWPQGTEPARAKSIGDLAFQTGDPETAARFYAEAVPLCDERWACALVRLGRREEGAALLARAVRADPWNVGALLRLHDILQELDQPGPPPPGGVAVCLYTSGKADELDATLAALAASNPRETRFLVLDNASPDRTPEVLGAWSDRLGEKLVAFRLPVNIGAPAARNWLMTRPEVRACAFTAYLDDDALVPPDWLGRFGTAVSAFPDAWVWGCLTADQAAPGRLQNADIHLEWERGDAPNPACLCAQDLDYGQFAYLRPSLSVTGCCHLFRTEALLAGGGFDIRFSPTQYDDLDHDLRQARAGGATIYQGHLKVLHARLSGALLHLDERATANSMANLRKLAAKHPPDALEALRRRDEDLLARDLARKRERVRAVYGEAEPETGGAACPGAPTVVCVGRR
ncbi:glycosyltransferase [Fundidesulfovibrio butyratiphilus]